jgi:hypothetical protein
MSTPSANPFEPKEPATVPAPAVPPGDLEEVYFQGSPPMRAFSGSVFLCTVAAIVLIGGGVALQVKHLGPPPIRLVLCILGLAALPLTLLIARSIYYRITSYRIDYGRGLLSRDIDTLELWHVEDLHFHQSVMDRILNVGDITILSHDETLPKLDIHGVPNPKVLYEELKQRVISVKRQRGVIKMDPG